MRDAEWAPLVLPASPPSRGDRKVIVLSSSSSPIGVVGKASFMLASLSAKRFDAHCGGIVWLESAEH